MIILLFGCLCSHLLYSGVKDTCELSDIEGHSYRIISVGKYLWMAENLRTKTYNDSTIIPMCFSHTVWKDLNIGACCYYNNEEKIADSLGLLYNWYAVNTGKLCPAGWRVPDDGEWKYLEGFADSLYGIGSPMWNERGLRGYDVGTKLKARSGWRESYTATDTYGFSALPGGEILTEFHGLGTSGFWWTSTEAGPSSAWYRNLVYSLETIDRSAHPKQMGFSVRCIRDK